MRCSCAKYIPLLVSFLLSLHFSDITYSQESSRQPETGGAIHGRVESDGKPLAGASVRLLELDRSTFADADGHFAFLSVPNGTYHVFVRIIGYTSAAEKIHVAGDDVEASFTLHESAIEAEEVVVSASPYARPADEQYQSAESKSMVELHDSPGSSFAEKISDIPGIEVRYNGSAPARPMIRGLSDNEVLVLENGLRTGDVSTYDPAHSVPIEPMSISQIDVVRGPACIIYGPNTIGGLINVITNTIPTASANPFSGTVSLSGNSASDEYTGYFNTVYCDGGHAISISAGGLHSQDTRIPTGSYFDGVQNFNLSRISHSFDHTREAGAGYSYQGDFGMIRIGYKHYEMNYGIPGTPSNLDWLNDPPTTSLIEQTKNSVEARSLFVMDGSAIRQIRISANYVDYNHSEFPTQEDSTGVSNPEANHFRKQAVNAMVQFQHQQLGSFQGTIGLWTNIENLTIEGQQPLGPNSITTGLAGYIFEEYLAGAGNRLQAGLRYDYNRIHAVPYSASLDPVFQTIDVTRLSNAVTASLGAVQDLSSGMTASLSIGRSFRAPTVQELFANGADAASNTYSIGDANLTPEASVGIDASLRGRFTNMSFEITPYLDFISDYIYAYLRGDTIQNLPVRQFAATNSRLLGFEVSAAVQPIEFIALEGQADYVNAEDTRNNVPLPFIPPLRGLFKVSYQDNTYSAILEWRLVASQTRLGVGDTYTAGYGVVNVGVGVRLTQEAFIHNISLHCDNLLNQVYRDNLSVIKDFVPQPARGFRLNYDLVF